MPLGPGKYDPLCTMVREATRAEAVILGVFGPEGVGFSVQAEEHVDGLAIANALQLIVDEMRVTYHKHMRGMTP